VKTSFWIYWAITIPLTTIVLVAYLTYLVRIQRKDRLEDIKIVRRVNDEIRNQSTHAAQSADPNRMNERGASTFTLGIVTAG